MKCENHPDKEGVAACVSCGKILCADCRLKLVGKNYCQECADDLVTLYSDKKEVASDSKPIKAGYGKVKPQSSPAMDNSYEKARPVKKDSSNRFLLFCLIFLVVLFFIALGLYIIYLLYLAPFYGDLSNVINILLTDPQRIINFLIG